jgi:hypothetical protein
MIRSIASGLFIIDIFLLSKDHINVVVCIPNNSNMKLRTMEAFQKTCIYTNHGPTSIQKASFTTNQQNIHLLEEYSIPLYKIQVTRVPFQYCIDVLSCVLVLLIMFPTQQV